MSNDLAVIEKYAGKINVDVRSGWEAGLKGRIRVIGGYADRTAPEHLTGPRLLDWESGRDAATRLLSTRMTIFSGKNCAGKIEVKRKGWPQRWPVVMKMASDGCYGDIDVYYMEDGQISRHHCCGI